MNDSADRLLYLMKVLGINQSRLAEITKRSQTSISHYVNRKRKKIDADFLIILQAKLQVNLEWFLNGNGEVFGPSNSGSGVISLDKENREMLEKIDKRSGTREIIALLLEIPVELNHLIIEIFKNFKNKNK